MLATVITSYRSKDSLQRYLRFGINFMHIDAEANTEDLINDK